MNKEKLMKLIATVICIIIIFFTTFTVGYREGKADALEVAARQPPKVVEKVVYKTVEKILVQKNGVKKQELHFDSENVTEISNITEDQINNVLNSTGLRGLGKAYIEAEKEYNINALFLVSLTANESAWGKSRLAKEKNNISGFTAYDYNPFNKGHIFSSKEECILITAKWLAEEYLNPNGKYYNGLSIKDINKKYAKDVDWYKKIISISNKLKTKI